MRMVSKTILLVMFVMAVAGCDKAMQKITGVYIKSSMTDLCGEEDEDCIVAVDEQYGSCETKYESEWSAYMNAGSSVEDDLLDEYMSKLYTCVVDKDGDTYFEYDLE